jgi:membrane-associated phospholipid phosphatase
VSLRLTRRAALTGALTGALAHGPSGPYRQGALAAPPDAAGSVPLELVRTLDVVHQTVASTALVPPVAARAYAAALVAVHDAAAPAAGLTPLLPGLEPDIGFSPDPVTAARFALALLLPRLLVDSAGRPITAPDLRLPAGGGRSARWGASVAVAVLEVTARDGAVDSLRRSATYVAPTSSGSWRPTPPSYTPAVAPFWGTVRTWRPGPARRLPGPPEWSPSLASEFGLEALTVRDQTLGNTADDVGCARFWADGAGTTTPAGHWVGLAGQLIEERQLTLRRFVRLCGDLGPVLHDAFVWSWAEKYRWSLARPITYLQDHVDPSFAPLLPTPSFPEYPSGHSTVSTAAAEVLTRYLGPGGFTDRTAEQRGLGVRTHNSLRAAAREASYSRLCGGIHYPAGLTDGQKLGTAVGRR